MTFETWVVIGLAVFSVIGLAWPKIVAYILEIPPASSDERNPDSYQRRMDLVNDLLRECEGCEEEKKAVVTAGDVIAKHWLDCTAVKKGGRTK